MDEIRIEVTERTADAIQRVDQNHVLTSRVNEKLDAVLAMLESQSSEPGMRNYQISTPVQAPPGMEGQGLPGIMETHTPAQAQRSPHFEHVDERPIPAIPVPRCWRGAQHNGTPLPPPMTSFVENGGNGYRQREWRGTEDRTSTANLRQQTGSLWGPGAPIMTNQNFKICQKPNQRLFVFDGMMINFKLWRNRVKDHLCNRSTRRYESLLDNIEKTRDEITKASLLNSTVDGVNAWEVAEELEGFVFDFVDQHLYERRGQFTNGEPGNGFEAWRQLVLEYSGGSAIANVGGFRRIQEFPRCEDLKKLGQHLADWEETIGKNGQNLMRCPDELRTMTLGVIPKS